MRTFSPCIGSANNGFAAAAKGTVVQRTNELTARS
jgi:hypothetical protein